MRCNMNAEIKHPKTLAEAVVYFSDLDRAHAFFVKMRWPDGTLCCPFCGSVEVRYLPKYRRFQCSSSHKSRQFTVKAGTIMEDSPMGLDKWGVAMWLEANSKNSVSSYEIQRALGITQKSAWFMLHRIREALHGGSLNKIGGKGGSVEVDETFIGGAARFMHKSRRTKMRTGGADKVAVMGLLERHGEKGKSKVRVKVIPNVQRDTLHGEIVKNVKPGTNVYTDAWRAYQGMPEHYVHEFVDHMESYARGAVHTNGLENFWALFKRCIRGTHVSIDPAHLFRYLDSEVFRFNNRKLTDGERLQLVMRGITGKRLTYKALIGAMEGTPGNGKDGARGIIQPS
jgi:transposase-like protein